MSIFNELLKIETTTGHTTIKQKLKRCPNSMRTFWYFWIFHIAEISTGPICWSQKFLRKSLSCQNGGFSRIYQRVLVEFGQDKIRKDSKLCFTTFWIVEISIGNTVEISASKYAILAGNCIDVQYCLWNFYRPRNFYEIEIFAKFCIDHVYVLGVGGAFQTLFMRILVLNQRK